VFVGGVCEGEGSNVLGQHGRQPTTARQALAAVGRAVSR
jgi:hypothetical protein